MKPKRIILVRHGESEAEVDHTLFSSKPDSNHLLTEAGHLQAHEAGRKVASLLKEDMFGVFVSPYMRTLHRIRLHRGEKQDQHLSDGEGARRL